MKIIYIISIFLFIFCFTGCQKITSEDRDVNQEQETIEEKVTEVGNADRLEEINSQAIDIGKTESQEDIASDAEDIDLDDDSDLIEKINKYMIPEQSFDITLDDWGEVTFASCKPAHVIPHEYASFYLLRDDEILYQFPYRYEDNVMGHPGFFDNVGAVAFRDINADEKTDIIVITYYFSGAGPTGMVPRPDIRIFLAGENEFYIDDDMEIDVAEHIAEKDMTIETVWDFLLHKS